MSRKVKYAWLQISDLHIFGDSVTEWNTLKKEISQVKGIEDVRFILITGDLHQYGHGYEETIKFLEFLLNQLHLEKKSLFIVPGNHDSGSLPDDDSKSSNKNAYTSLIRSEIEKNPDIYQDYFVEKKLVGCFREFNEFVRKFYGDENSYDKPEQVCVQKWCHESDFNTGINIVHLNTAIACNNVKGEKCIIDINSLSRWDKNMLNNNWPTIIIAHHPFWRLAVSHQNFLKRLCSNWNVKAYFCGDEHKQMIDEINISIGNKLGTSIPCIVCGKISPENGDTYSDIGMTIFRKYEAASTVEIDPYIWNKEKKCFQPYVDAYINGELPTFDFDIKKADFLSEKGVSKETEILVSGESIWLPDAEKAQGKQTRFDSFTNTRIINEFLLDSPPYWGISAPKGVGKTFVLQVKRMRIDKSRRICLPLGVIPSAGNGWGTDSIKLNDVLRIRSLKNIENVKKLWQYSIVVYAINQMGNIRDKLHYNKARGEHTSEEGLRRMLECDMLKKRISEFTFDLCTDSRYMNLNDIMHGVLHEGSWAKKIAKDLGQLVLYRSALIKTLDDIGKEKLAIFIDKVDQAIAQTKAGREDPCQNCINYQMFLKDLDRAESENKMDMLVSPCLSCNLIIGEEGRIYSSENEKLAHVSIWQYLQLGLLWAIDDIREEFKDLIEVYFTIREEAFACEDALFGMNKRKITKNVCSLAYTKEEQKDIFMKCIEDEWDDYLYEPKMKKKSGKQEEAFVGVKSLCHPYVENLKEDVFDSIYRHSFDRARDIQDYGKMLSQNLPKLRTIDSEKVRGEEVKTFIEQKAAELAFTEYEIRDPQKICYYDEKRDLLPGFWAKRENFGKLLSYFKKNLMFCDEAKEICRRFNNCAKCKERCIGCAAKHHPFSVLYKMGMLGKINILSGYTDVSQEFCEAKDVTYISSREIENLNDHMIYVLHPALTKSIDTIYQPLMHFGGFIIGKDQRVNRKLIEELKICYESEDIKAYEKKYFFTKSQMIKRKDRETR